MPPRKGATAETADVSRGRESTMRLYKGVPHQPAGVGACQCHAGAALPRDGHTLLDALPWERRVGRMCLASHTQTAAQHPGGRLSLMLLGAGLAACRDTGLGVQQQSRCAGAPASPQVGDRVVRRPLASRGGGCAAQGQCGVAQVGEGVCIQAPHALDPQPARLLWIRLRTQQTLAPTCAACGSDPVWLAEAQRPKTGLP